MIDVGAVLSGRFVLRATLGVEGVATVWDAQDTVLDRRVLISVLRADLAANAVEVERFQREMRAAARADSASGARVLDAGEDPTTRLPFVVFEWRPRQPAATVQPAPMTVQPAPVTAQPAPVTVQPAPVTARPAPVTVQPARGSAGPRQTAARSPGGLSGQPGPVPPAASAPVRPAERAVPLWLEHPKAARRVTPRGPSSGRSGRAVQGLVLVLILVPLAVGALLIRNFLQQPSPVPPQLFSLAGGAPGTPTVGNATTTAAASQPAATPAPAAPAQPAPAQPAPAQPAPAQPAPAQPAPAQPAQAQPAQAQPAQAQRAATSVPAARAVASAPVRATPAASPIYAGGERRRVANTDGQGVALRATPGGDRLAGKGYDEGTTVTLLEVQGTWAHIRGDDGREGWVLAVTLVP